MKKRFLFMMVGIVAFTMLFLFVSCSDVSKESAEGKTTEKEEIEKEPTEKDSEENESFDKADTDSDFSSKEDSTEGEQQETEADTNNTSLEYIRYYIDEECGECKITGLNSAIVTDVIIPNSIEGFPVRAIEEGAFSEGVTLNSVIIPDSVVTIGDRAFNDCINLTSIKIGKGLLSIGYKAFFGCVSLKEIIVDESNANFTSIDGNLYTKDGTTILKYSAGKPETSFVVPSSVKYIGDNAFDNSKNLFNIELPESLISIEEDAFLACSNFTSIVIPSQVESIDDAFPLCFSLVEIINNSSLDIRLDNSLGEIFESAIEVHKGESKLEQQGDFLFYSSEGKNYLVKYLGEDIIVTLPSEFKGQNYSVYKYAFYKDDLISVTIPDNITEVSARAFFDCRNLFEMICSPRTFTSSSNVDIMVKSPGSSKIVLYGDFYFYPDEDRNYLLKYVGDKANVILPESYEGESYVIHQQAFKDCDFISSLTVPASVLSIGRGAFFNCIQLKEIILEEGVQEIQNQAFAYCINLKNVSLPQSLERVKHLAFQNCPNLEYTKYEGAYYLGNEESPYIVVMNNDDFCQELKLHKDTRIIHRLNGSISSVYSFENVIAVEEYAFYNLNNLKTATLSDNVKYIEESAFADCNALEEFKVPRGVSELKAYTFQSDKSLTTVFIPSTIEFIDKNTFEYCSNLKYVYYEGTEDTWNDIFANSTEYIPDDAVVYYYSETKPETEGDYWYYNGDIPTVW